MLQTQYSVLSGTLQSFLLLTLVHSAEHAGNEFVDAIALFDQGHQRCDTAFVVGRHAERRKHRLLETVDAVLDLHQVIDGLETDKGKEIG